MRVYRAETEDGGGPYFKLDGTPRDLVVPPLHNNDPSSYLYGADSIEHLKQLITSYGFNFDDYILKEYDIPFGDIVKYNTVNGHIVFEKEQK